MAVSADVYVLVTLNRLWQSIIINFDNIFDTFLFELLLTNKIEIFKLLKNNKLMT